MYNTSLSSGSDSYESAAYTPRHDTTLLPAFQMHNHGSHMQNHLSLPHGPSTPVQPMHPSTSALERLVAVRA
jgi:hypothetical protein